MFKADKPWENQREAALAAYRTAVHSSIGMGPFRALYVRGLKTCRLDCQLQSSQAGNNTLYDRVQSSLSWLLTTWNTIRSQIANSRFQNEKRACCKNESELLEVGDTTLVLKPGPQSSFDTKWQDC